MDILLHAFRMAFPNESEPVALVIVGDGPERQFLEELTMNDSRIRFLGARSDVARVYRAIDAFISPSRFEPFGIAIMEAMAAGLPLVLTGTDGPRGFVPELYALWAEPGDATGLAQQLKSALALGRARCEYDLTPLHQDYATALTEDFYRKTLRAKATKRGPA
jgi:glycosyltransferase involved in cell wall biosynthesis